ncbi:MAG: flagellar type III secretion system protein FliR [Sphingomonadales bacterium]|nr:flagellar type III secretion system protein FliR [Sphingomonadales bacterium]
MLGDILPEEAFRFFLVFTRMGAIMMLLPAIGEVIVSSRIRLLLGLSISFLIYSVVGSALPSMPASPLDLGVLLFIEIFIGLMIGGAMRLVMTALHVTGTIISFQTGLAAAQHFDPAQGTQGALLSSVFSIAGVTLIFVTDMHHLLIGAMRYSYEWLPVGQGLQTATFAELVVGFVAGAFMLGVQLSAPFLVYGMVYNIGLGIVARLMPQLPVFFIGMPLNIFVGFFLLSIVIGAMFMWFIGYFEEQVMFFLP